MEINRDKIIALWDMCDTLRVLDVCVGSGLKMDIYDNFSDVLYLAGDLANTTTTIQ